MKLNVQSAERKIKGSREGGTVSIILNFSNAEYFFIQVGGIPLCGDDFCMLHLR